MVKCQKCKHNLLRLASGSLRRIRTLEGRQWMPPGLTLINIEYQGRTARLEALVLPSFEDEIFLCWTILRDLIIGNQSLTADKGSNDKEPKTSHNHAKPTRVAQQKNEYHTPSRRSCPGCEAKGELFHFRDNCPNKYKICYNSGRQGKIREVCRARRQPQIERSDRQKIDHRPPSVRVDKTYPPPASEFKGMSQYPTLPI